MIEVGDLLIPVHKLKELDSYVFWKRSRYMVVKSMLDDEGYDQGRIEFINEEQKVMVMSGSFIYRLIEKSSLKLVRDEVQKAKILLIN